MNDEWSQVAANAVCHAADMVRENIRWVSAGYERPSVLFRPSLRVDGNQWCALYGENLQDGVAGFGNSPQEAMHDFDGAWKTAIAAAPKPEDA